MRRPSPVLNLVAVGFLVWIVIQVVSGGARLEAVFEAGVIVGAGLTGRLS